MLDPLRQRIKLWSWGFVIGYVSLGLKTKAPSHS